MAATCQDRTATVGTQKPACSRPVCQPPGSILPARSLVLCWRAVSLHTHPSPIESPHKARCFFTAAAESHPSSLRLCKAPSFLSVKSTAWPPGCLTWLGFLSDLGSLHPSPALVRPQGLCTCWSCSFSTHHVSFRSFLYGHFARLFPVTDLRWHFRHLQSLCPDTFLCSTCPQLASGVYFVLG